MLGKTGLKPITTALDTIQQLPISTALSSQQYLSLLNDNIARTECFATKTPVPCRLLICPVSRSFKYQRNKETGCASDNHPSWRKYLCWTKLTSTRWPNYSEAPYYVALDIFRISENVLCFRYLNPTTENIIPLDRSCCLLSVWK